jgi:hypothetical protein
MHRKLIILAVAIIIYQTIQAQTPYPQIRFKAGFSFLYPSPSTKGYAFKAPAGTRGSILLGGEFNHPFKSQKGAWHVGFTFEDADNTPSANTKNLFYRDISGVDFTFAEGPPKTTIYGGFEKYLNRDISRPSKNYFSVFGGAGIAFTLNSLKADWSITTNQKFYTREGGIAEGYTSNFSRSRIPIAPFVYGGIRYNITNAKGNDVVIIELRGSYDLAPYYRQTIDYTLNGVAMQDRLKPKGFSLQLNLIVPLYSFRKKTVKKLPALISTN